jgi:hypothetical protein
MRTRTLERLQWVSVLCLMGAAVCFAWVERQTAGFEGAQADFPSPAPGAAVKASIDVPQSRSHEIRMEMPLPASARDSLHLPQLPSQPAGLRVSVTTARRDAKQIDIPALRFCSEYPWGGIAIYCSEPFELSAGRHEITVSVTDDRLPPGRALSIVGIGDAAGFLIMRDVTRFLGWLALAIGAALWASLVFARPYVVSDSAS